MIRGFYDGSAPATPKDAVYIGTNVTYAAYVELGTSKMAAQPYLTPALANHVRKYKNIIRDEMENAGN